MSDPYPTSSPTTNSPVQFVAPEDAPGGPDELRPAGTVTPQLTAPTAALNSKLRADAIHPSENAKLPPQRVIAVVLLIALAAGALYFYLLTGNGSGTGDTIVALVNGAAIRQSDVDVQVNLSKAIDEVMGETNSNITADQILGSLVFERLAMQDVRKHNYPVATEAEIESYLAATPALSNVTAASFDTTLTKYNVARSVFSDSLITNLTIENYKNDKIASPSLAADQRDLLLNNWKSALYDTRTAQISYPNPLRADNGPAAQVNHLAPEIAGVDLNSGQQIVLSKLQGHPVVINFWATWCGPCRTEMPMLVSAYNTYRASNALVVLAVDTESASARQQALDFIQQYKMSFPVIQDDDSNTISLLYDIIATPSSFFVDSKGMIQAVQIGAMDAPTLQSNLSKILK